MQLTDILSPERTFHAASGSSKKRIFEFLASQFVEGNHPAHVQIILDAFMARERLGSTGLGLGIAIPHCRLDTVSRCTGALLTLAQPINFDAPDRQPVDLLFVLVVPSRATNEHLEILAELAKRFSDTDYCHSLRNANNKRELYEAALRPVSAP